jgi:transposase-like protein
MCFCSCFCLSSCSSWHSFVSCTGPMISLPTHKQRPCVPRSNAFSSHALRLIAPSVASPAPPSSVVGPAPAPVRPWREGKSRRGAPKRVNTEGFACPNRECPYFGIKDAHIHALVGDGKHGLAERIQTFRCLVCHTTFSARRHTPLYRLKTPSHQIAVVLTALAEGLDPSAAERVAGLPASHDHHLAGASWRARADLARALFSHFAAPASPVGRTAHQAALLYTGALAGHRPPHEDSSRPPAWTPHAKYGA